MDKAMSILPEDLTADNLLKWQDDLEAELERALLGYTEKALSVMVGQAVRYELTAASARFLWEEAVTRALADLGLGDDRFLLEDLLQEDLGSDAFDAVNEVLAQRPEDLRAALEEALDLGASLTASGATEEFWSEDNWIEQTGTGHLPPYIRDIADALMRNGYDESRAIATAVNTVKRWAKGGPARQGGPGSVTKETQIKAAKALVEWEAKRIEAKANAVQDPGGIAAFALIQAKTVRKWRTRIKRVVRTSFTGVVGRLTLAELRLRGIKTKTWVTKRDSRVRPTHREADGQTVPMEAYFRVGNESLMYPGEHGKALAEIANCRCIIVPG